MATDRDGRAASREAQELCEAVRTAFAGVKLGAGIGLGEADAVDDYADASTRAARRAGDEREDWQRIPAEELNLRNCGLSYFDPEGMRFHLPAYLLAELRGQYRYDLATKLTADDEYSKGQFALLSPEQRSAVRAVLAYLRDEPSYAYDRVAIDNALNAFWAEPA